MDDDLRQLQPWMRGPFELLRHANGHLMEGSDTDRRVALIGFDNAIEVCIDVFMRLHPRLRHGFQVPRERAQDSRQGFYSKIQFLDSYIEQAQKAVDLPVEAIVWYHQLRNELYHSGNGMVPEMHVITGARDASIKVFAALFEVDVSPLLQTSPSASVREPALPYIATDNVQMELLRVFVTFETALKEFLQTHHADDAQSLRTLREMWRYYSGRYSVATGGDKAVRQAIEARNAIVHGGTVDLQQDAIIKLVVELMEWTAMLEDRT